MSKTEVNVSKSDMEATSLSGHSDNLKSVVSELKTMEDNLRNNGSYPDALLNKIKSVRTALDNESVNLTTLSKTLRQCLDLYETAEKNSYKELTNIAEALKNEDAFKKGGLAGLLASILETIVNVIHQILINIGIVPGGGNDSNSEYVAEPVNVCTGNYVSDVTEISFSGEMKLEFVRHYNTMYRQNGCMGTGWTHNYEISLEENEDVIDLCMGDGWRERFVKSDDGLYRSSFGTMDYINKSEGYVCYLKKSGIYYFDENKKLKTIRSHKGTAIAFVYQDGKLSEAVDEAGRKLIYHYNDENLVSVTDHTGREVKLGYEGNLLKTVTSADGTVKTYGYDDKARLERIKNGRGITTIVNTYDDEDRVICQKMADGTDMRFEYKDNDVIVTQRDGSVITYRHNDKYQATEVLYSNGQESYEYDDNRNRTLFRTICGTEYRSSYDDSGNMVSLTDPMGGQIKLCYLKDDQPVETEDKNGAKTYMEYNENGDLSRYTDELGYKTCFEYDGRRLVGVVYDDGSKETMEYDVSGNITKKTDSEGNEWSFVYDAAGRKVKEIDPRGNSTVYEYDSMDRVTRIINADGDERQFKYSETGKVTRVIDFDGSSEEWNYDEMEQINSHLDKDGHMTEYMYDKMNHVIEVRLPNGGIIRNTYDERGNRTSVTDPEGKVTRYDYDQDGRVIGRESGGLKEQFTYDPCGRMISISENGNTKSVERDANGNVTALIHANGSRFEYVFDAAGQCVLRRDPRGKESRYEYDNRRRLAAIIENDSIRRKFTYYSNGKVKRVEYSNGSYMDYSYDAALNLIERRYSNGYSIRFEYDSLNRCVCMSDSNGQKYESVYDKVGNVIKRTDGAGTVYQYTYSNNKKLLSVTDPLDTVTRYSYNCFGKMTGISQAYGEEERTIEIERNLRGNISKITDTMGNSKVFEYDLNGNMICVENANHEKIHYEYTPFGQVAAIKYSDGREVDFAYDEMNRMIQYNDWNGTSQMEYDEMGKLVTTIDHEGRKLEYKWDQFGRKHEIIYPSGKRIHYNYDDFGRMSEIQGEEVSVKYEYNDNGELIKKSLGDHSAVIYDYTYDGKISKTTYFDASGFLSDEEITYDFSGKIVGKTIRNKNMNSAVRYAYQYDALGRLVEESCDDRILRRFKYDSFGNRTVEELVGERRESAYNSLNQIISQRIIKDDVEHEVKWAYDSCGRMISKEVDEDSWKYLYDSAGKLSGIEKKDGSKTSFSYTGMGMRLEAVESESGFRTSYFYDASMDYNGLLSICDQLGEKDYIYDGQLVGELHGSENNYYLCDRQGSVIHYLSQDGISKCSYEYDVFGSHSSVGENLTTQPFGYAGMLFDAHNDYYHTNAREYLPEIGRFMQRDDERFIHENQPESVNLYSYCFNNPLMYIDPTGNDCYYFYMPGSPWEEIAAAEQKALADQYGYSIDQVHMVKVTSNQELIDGWNQMGMVDGKPVDIDTVVVLTHANPEGMGYGDDYNDYFSIEDVQNSLQSKDVDQVFLYGCNTAHSDGDGNNIAGAFSKKVSGAPVLASDGTVYHSSGALNHDSRNDKHWEQWRDYYGSERENNDGWKIYRQEDGKTVITETGEKDYKINQMLERMRNYRRENCLE